MGVDDIHYLDTCRKCDSGATYFVVMFDGHIMGFDSSFRSLPDCVFEVADGFNLKPYADRTLRMEEIEKLSAHLRPADCCPHHAKKE